MGWLSLVLTVISLRERIRSQIRGAVPPVRAVVLDVESVSIIDLEGSDMLKKIAEELEDLEIAFIFAG